MMNTIGIKQIITTPSSQKQSMNDIADAWRRTFL